MTINVTVDPHTTRSSVWAPGEIGYTIANIGSDAVDALDPRDPRSLQIRLFPEDRSFPELTRELPRSLGSGWGRPPPTAVVSLKEGTTHCGRFVLSAAGGVPAGQYRLAAAYLTTDRHAAVSSSEEITLEVSRSRAHQQSVVVDCPGLSRVLIMTRCSDGRTYIRRQGRKRHNAVAFERELSASKDADELVLAHAGFFAPGDVELWDQSRLVERRGHELLVRALVAGEDNGVVARAPLPDGLALAGGATWEPGRVAVTLRRQARGLELWEIGEGGCRRLSRSSSLPESPHVLAKIRGDYHLVHGERGLTWERPLSGHPPKSFGPFAHRVRSVRIDRKSGFVQAIFDGGRGATTMHAVLLNLRTGELREQEVHFAGLESPLTEVAAGISGRRHFFVARTQRGHLYTADRGNIRQLDRRVDDPEQPSFLFASTHGRPCFGLSSMSRGIELFDLNGASVW